MIPEENEDCKTQVNLRSTSMFKDQSLPYPWMQKGTALRAAEVSFAEHPLFRGKQCHLVTSVVQEPSLL